MALSVADNEILEEQDFFGQAPDSNSDVSGVHACSTEPNVTPRLPLPVDDGLAKTFADEQIERQFAQINAVYEEILSREGSAARSLFPFIRAKLFQYRLWPLCDEVSILQEVYARTVGKIMGGREVTNYYGWIRSVSFRYIRELSRKHSRSLGVDESLLQVLAPVKVIDEGFLADEMLKMHRAFQDFISFGKSYSRRVGIHTRVVHLPFGRNISHGCEHPSIQKIKAPRVRPRWSERIFRTYKVESGCIS